MSSTKRKIVVLISGSGTNLQALIDALDTPALPSAEIALVLSNRKAAYGLTRAAQANPPISTAYLALATFLKQNPGKTREDYDAEVAKIVLRARPDIVVLAGWMHILSEKFLELIEGRKTVDSEDISPQKPIPVINLHPALPGQFDGANAIERAFEAFTKGEITKSGAMVHRVVKDVDRGEPIVVREVVFVEGQTVADYEAKLHGIEHEIIVEATKKVLEESSPDLFSLPALRDLVLPGSFSSTGNYRLIQTLPSLSMSNSKRDSIVWPLYGKGEVHEENAGHSNSPVPSQRVVQHEEMPTSPRLEVSDIVDAVPFSQNFTDLFDSLGLHIPASAEQKNQFGRSCNLSYETENCADVKEIDGDWRLDEIEGNVIMLPKRPFELSTIQEEPSTFGMPLLELSDFSIEDSEVRPGAQISKDTRLCIKRDSGQRYVLKRRRMRKDSEWSEKTILEMLARSPRPFIDAIRWTFSHEEYVYIVLDHYPEGTLWDLVVQHGPLGSHRAAFYAAELVSAIASLHAVGIAHRDLEPRNVALDSQGHIVLTNFGLAKSVSGVQHQGMSCPMTFGEAMSEYRAPEIFLGWAHDLGVDCWSFGMVLYFMIFGTHPYGAREGVDDPRWLYDRVVVFPLPTESLRLVHPMARDLITKCLQRNASMRWSTEQIKSHRYFDLVDWDAVAAKEIHAPSFQRTAMEIDRSTVQTETQPRRFSLDNSISYHDHNSHDLSKDSELNLRKAAKGLRVLDAPLSSDFFRPLSIATIPSAIQEEDEPTSASASTGHISLGKEEPSLPQDVEPMSDFWAEIDKEAKGSAASFTSKEFGRSGFVQSKIPKLRKYRSVMNSNRLFSLNTSSFQKKLRKKPRSAGSLRPAQQQQQQQSAEPIVNLPVGLHQIGSGIGFTYNIPAEVPSKVSVRSFAPSCQHLFHVPGKINRGLGFGQPSTTRKAKSSTGNPGSSSTALASARTPPAQSASNSNSSSREVGNGTFIRDMYRTPSWILSRPDSLPSPLALVNSALDSDSPLVNGSEPLTPATLVDDGVDGEEGRDHSGEVNIRIPKHLELDLDLDFRMWRNGSTLRLVPQPQPQPPARSAVAFVSGKVQMEDSFSMDTESLYTQVTSVTGAY